jgi:hypothetical protein
MMLGEMNSTEFGASAVNRTLDQNTMNTVASLINSYPLADRFNPTYNAYAWNVYNTLSLHPFTLYLEYVHKTPEAIMDYSNVLMKKGGNVYYGSLSYSSKGIGVNAQYKRIANFPFRTSPLENQPSPNNAPVNYLPSITRQNTYRLLARYNAVVQELGENAAQVEVTLKPNKQTQINLNGSIVNKLAGVSANGFLWDSTNRLFSEAYGEFTHKFTKSFKVMIGIQHINYNQEVFEAKATAPFVTAITPFGEITYRMTRTHSLRFEWQYMHTKQDLGKFVNGLMEFNMAPHWSFAVADLLNFEPGALNTPAGGGKFERVHYYNFFTSYTFKTTRVAVAYLKQPQGVNCTGGVCRVEPAFSGGRITLSTNF